MFTRSVCFALLGLALSSFTVQAAPARGFEQQQPPFCDLPVSTHTVVHTVTVTSHATATPPPIQNSGKGNAAGNNQGNNQGKNSQNNNGKKNDDKQNQKNSDSNKNNSKNGSKDNNGSKNNGGSKDNSGSKNNGGSGNNTDKNNGKNGSDNGKNGGSSATGSQNNSGNNGGKNDNNGGKNSTGNSNDDPQTSLTLDPRVIAKGFADDGQDVPTAGQVPSLTSTNNFINFCLTVPNLPLTDGKQIQTGSCNPAPIGVIPSTDNMPSSKFVNPPNFGTLKANTPFTIEMNLINMQAGFFVNAQENYFAAPQTLNAQGQIQGHSHVVIESIDSLTSTSPTDPRKFAFFKGLNSPVVDGKLSADVANGLPAGTYRLASINTSSNHQPVIVPVAQHGSLDDFVYFTVTEDGKPVGGVAANDDSGADDSDDKGDDSGDNNGTDAEDDGDNDNTDNQNGDDAEDASDASSSASASASASPTKSAAAGASSTLNAGPAKETGAAADSGADTKANGGDDKANDVDDKAGAAADSDKDNSAAGKDAPSGSGAKDDSKGDGADVKSSAAPTSSASAPDSSTPAEAGADSGDQKKQGRRWFAGRA